MSTSVIGCSRKRATLTHRARSVGGGPPPPPPPPAPAPLLLMLLLLRPPALQAAGVVEAAAAVAVTVAAADAAVAVSAVVVVVADHAMAVRPASSTLKTAMQHLDGQTQRNRRLERGFASDSWPLGGV